MESLTLRSVVRDGDIFALLTDEGRVQLVEGHRPRTPSTTTKNVIHGILCDDSAMRLQVWIAKEDIGFQSSSLKVSDF